MAWTAPVTQVTGVLITAAIWNAQVSANLAYLHGDGGMVVYPSVANLSLGTVTGLTGAGQFLAIANASAVGGIPVGGGCFYVVGGALKWLGSAGTVSNVAPA